MNAYLDASAVVRVLLREPDWDRIAFVWRRADELYTNAVTITECRAAIGAAVRDRRVPRSAYPRVIEAMTKRFQDVNVLKTDRALASAAGDLADRMGLRALDAVHLASALVASLGGDMLLLTSDRRLADAARASGLSPIGAP